MEIPRDADRGLAVPSGGTARPVRVLHVIDRLSGAGAETSLRELLGSVRDDSHHGVAVLAPEGNDLRGIRTDSVHVFVPPQRRHVLDDIRNVSRAINAMQPDLVHTTLFRSDLAGRLAARRHRLPTLVSLVNTPYVAEARWDRRVPGWKWRAVRALDTVLARRATTAFHAITQAVADAAIRDQRIPADRVTVIPRGRRLERLGERTEARRRAARAMLGIGADDIVLLSVGREEPQKGQRYLIEALPRIQSAHQQNVLLVIAGRPGAASGQIDEAIARTDTEDSVRRLGYRDDIGDLLSTADVFVFPSLYEGLGGAMLEAMTMDLPVVASDIPALREVLDNGACGLLVPPARPAELAQAILRVIAEPGTADDRAATARKRVAERYDVHRINEEMHALFRRVAASNG